jgi:hypothetical protein
MMARTFDLKWVRVVVAGVVATVLAFAVVFLVVTVYAAGLAAQAQGAPDPDRIARFAEGTGAWLGPALALLFTAGAAWLVARSVASGAAGRHGLVVGLVVGLIVAAVDLGLGGSFGVGALVGFVLTVGAGWLGGRVGKRDGRSSQNTLQAKFAEHPYWQFLRMTSCGYASSTSTSCSSPSLARNRRSSGWVFLVTCVRLIASPYAASEIRPLFNDGNAKAHHSRMQPSA